MITERIDAVTHIPASSRCERPPAPRSVKIELTSRCNYRCKFCALETRAPGTTGDMAWPLFARIAREMRDAGVEEIGLFYLGEPFAAPTLLIRAIRYLKDEIGMPYVFVTSNASLATGVAVAACMGAGLDSLKWSANAGTPEQFVETTGVSERFFERALAHIAEAWHIRAQGGYRTRLAASSIRYDGAQGERMEAFLDAHIRPYVDEHYWLPLYSMGSLALPGERSLGYVPGPPGNVGRLDAPVPSLPCWAAFTEGHVLADGRLSACCFDAKGDWIMGDLTSQEFLEAWHSPAFQILRRAHLAGDVRGTVCEACQVCGT